MKSIVFFDDQCQLCRKTVNFLHREDKHHRLHFAALTGQTAHRYLSGKHARFRTLNTVVFLEVPSGRISIRGRAVFRILKALGGPWALVGWMHDLPFIDFFYTLIASHRKRGHATEPLHVTLLP